MKKTIILLLLTANLKAQNLVLNPSFEDTIPCSTFINLGTSQLQPVGWFSPTSGSPDYFSSVYDPFCYTVSVPSNSLGFQYPKTGVAFLGISTYADSTIWPNLREYIEGQLIDTLVGGHTYCVSFYVSAANNLKFIADGMGLKFSVDSLIDYNISTNLPVFPDIFNPSGNVLSDTMNWTQITGNYIATGGEKFITIGNFLPDSSTIIDSLNNNVTIGYRNTYYYIDDVSIIDCTVGINEIDKNQIGVLYPNPASKTIYYKASDKTGGQFILSDITGKAVMHIGLNLNDLVTTIPISNLPKGVYIVSVQKQKQKEVFKLVVN